MIPNRIETISRADIENLVTAQVSEHRTLDYKEQLPGGRDDDKRKFLYDVASFANASGGDLVFGVTDKRDADGKSTGLPASADGVPVPNVTEAVTRLENLIRDGIRPRIQGIQCQNVDGFPKGPVLVMRVPRSLIGPHMVVFGGMQRFYSRNSTGKYPLDVGEIRSAFMESSAVGERLHNIRAERLNHVKSGASPLGLVDTPMIVIHLLSISSLADVPRDVTKAAARLQRLLEPIREGQSYGGRFNFDGYLVTSAQSTSYVQVFRSGAIEAGDAGLLSGMRKQFPSSTLERDLLSAVQRYLSASNQLSTRYRCSSQSAS